MNLSTLEKTTIIDGIEETIRRRYTEGIDLTPEIEHFIESTYGAVSSASLLEFAGSKGGEKEELVDLLFSPDEPLQWRLEPFLGPEGLGPEECGALCERLRQHPLRAAVRIGGEQPIELFLPAQMVDGFTGRLHLDRPVDPALAAAVMARYPEKEALQVRVRLREARLSGADSEKEALSRLFSVQTPAQENFWPLLNYLIGVLESAAGGENLFAVLADRKRSCLRRLQEAVDRDKTLGRHNIETILVGGTRLPFIDSGALAREIVSIDELCLILFDRVAPAPIDMPPRDLGEISSPEDLERLSRFFMP